MKHIAFLTMVLFILFACATPVGGDSPQSVIDTWAKGLEEKNLKLIMSAYWPEAEAVYIDPAGNETVNSGADEIRDMQRGSTENTEYDLDVWRHVAELNVRGDEATCHIKVIAGEFTMTNILELEERDGRWGIIRQVIR